MFLTLLSLPVCKWCFQEQCFLMPLLYCANKWEINYYVVDVLSAPIMCLWYAYSRGKRSDFSSSDCCM
jgi:hypothetical protein